MAQTVLVVEDDKYMREVLVAKLGKEGFAVLEAVDGSTGLDMTAKKKPDLVVLDIILPVMNGFDYLEAKAKVAPIAAIPTIKELNIGHFLVGEAIFIGFGAAIRMMRTLMDDARLPPPLKPVQS